MDKPDLTCLLNLPLLREQYTPDLREMVQVSSERICRKAVYDIQCHLTARGYVLEKEGRHPNEEEIQAILKLYKDRADMFIWLISENLLIDKDKKFITLLDIVLQHLALKAENQRGLGTYILDNHRDKISFSELDKKVVKLDPTVQDRVFCTIWRYMF